MKEYNCFFDGACEPCNPGGKLGIGIYITDGVNEFKNGISLPSSPENTNNIAEYKALIRILLFMSKKEGCRINIHGDSMLVIKQMNKEWKSKGGSYIPFKKKAEELLQKIRSHNEVYFKWIPRDQNFIADEQSKKNL